jgi:hypothetical protein
VTSGWGYALLCVVVPFVWGLAMAALFSFRDRRSGRRRRVDYSI